MNLEKIYPKFSEMDLIAIRSDEIRRVVKCVVCQGIAEIASKEIQGSGDEPFNIYRGGRPVLR